MTGTSDTQTQTIETVITSPTLDWALMMGLVVTWVDVIAGVVVETGLKVEVRGFLMPGSSGIWKALIFPQNKETKNAIRSHFLVAN